MSSIRLKHASGNSMSLAAPGTNPASNLELKLPHTIGSANQLLKVDANGQLGWADDNSGLSLSNDANNRIVTGTGSGLNAEANLTFDGSTLDIFNGSNSSTIKLKRHASTASQQAHIGYFSSGLHIETREATYLTLKTNTTERIRIESGGDVIMGTIANDLASHVGSSRRLAVVDVANGALLHLRGQSPSIFLDCSSGGKGSVYLDGHEFAIFSGTPAASVSERLRINSDGKIGINDTNPGALLTVNNGTTDGQMVWIKNEEVGVFIGAYGAGTSYAREATINGSRIDSGTLPFLRIAGQGGIKFCVDLNTERARINNSGEFGINVSPLRKLHVKSGANNNDGAFRIESATSNIMDMGTDATGHFLNCVNTDPFRIKFAGSEKVRINSSGKTVIEIDSSDTTDTDSDTLILRNTNNSANTYAGLRFEAASSANADYHIVCKKHSAGGGANLHIGEGTNTRMIFKEGGTLLIGATSSDMNSADNKGYTFTNHATSPYLRVKHSGSGGSYANHSLLHLVGGSSMIGEIKQDGDGTVTYATSSDYRLKENIVDLTGAITRIKNLKPKRFNFKANSGLTKDGFLAHELQEVVPESVNGTKDEVVTADSKVNIPTLEDLEVGDPVYQTADASRIVPLITAALKEAITKIETLETKVEALEAG